MARWKLGESDVEALLAAGELQKLTGAAANGERLLEKATVTLTTLAQPSILTPTPPWSWPTTRHARH